MPAQLVPTKGTATEVACDVLIVGATSDNGLTLQGAGAEVDRALEGYLAESLSDASFKGKIGEIVTLPSFKKIPAKTIAVVGLGEGAPSPNALRRAAGAAARRLSDQSVLASALTETDPDSVTATAEGFLLGSYRFVKYRSDPRPSRIDRILLLGGAPTDSIDRAVIRSEATILARDLTNEPGGTLTPEALARHARELADANGLECTVLDEKELADKGFGGILGVGKGSNEPPRLIMLRHAPSGARGKVALIGKGITFDSGGLSLKDAKNMEQMKTDMAGGAAVIATMSALPKLDIPLEVIAYVPASENMPGGKAIKPGDAIIHYGGHTSEVLNTDAEGRLVLADALAFASEEKPDAMVDAATLTGGMMVALGRLAIGMFANDDRLAEELTRAAESAGEPMWRMPIFDELRPELDSEIADIKNSGSRYGSPIFGALFLRDFVGKGIPWAHLDIAGPARAEADRDEMVKGGTGVAVRTLLNWIEGRIR